MKNIFFEELENVEDLGDFADFCKAAEPWVFGGITLAVALAT